MFETPHPNSDFWSKNKSKGTRGLNSPQPRLGGFYRRAASKIGGRCAVDVPSMCRRCAVDVPSMCCRCAVDVLSMCGSTMGMAPAGNNRAWAHVKNTSKHVSKHTLPHCRRPAICCDMWPLTKTRSLSDRSNPTNQHPTSLQPSRCAVRASTCVRPRACVHACVRACVRACVHMHPHACVCACVRARLRASTCVRACVHACVRACLRFVIDRSLMTEVEKISMAARDAAIHIVIGGLAAVS